MEQCFSAFTNVHEEDSWLKIIMMLLAFLIWE